MSILGGFRGRKGQEVRLSDMDENFTRYSGCHFGSQKSILGVKKVKNVGSPIFMIISPEKYFDSQKNW